MFVTQMELELGFRQANIDNIPQVGSDTIFNFAAATGKSSGGEEQSDLLMDYVQLRRQEDICEVNALVFPAADFSNSEAHANVIVNIDEKQRKITATQCNRCSDNAACAHVIAFLFWLHHKSTSRGPAVVHEFWGHEYESLSQQKQIKPCRIRELFPSNEVRMEADLEIEGVSSAEGQAFLEAVLEDMDNMGLRDAALYRQCVETTDEFEPILVHHVMLNSIDYNIMDVGTFVQHMEIHAARGLFDSLNDITKNAYKSALWLEAQYMRLRCSLMHRIASRKSPEDDEQILKILFCKNRDVNLEERQQQKQHKRFILKQTEKLENKTYYECGLLLHESHPYLVAAPDGITDDHIVEIKAPKTEEEFEKYLESRETIAAKYMAQIQIQMYMANVSKALYCVLSPTFDTNGALHYVWVQADNEFVISMLNMAEDFWKDVVFPRLEKIYKRN